MDKPLLASEADLNNVRFPVMASAKLDGIRCIMDGGTPRTRSAKPIPNAHIHAKMSGAATMWPALCNLDGELIVGPANAPDVYRKTNSAAMRYDGSPAFEYHVFDVTGMKKSFRERYEYLVNLKTTGKLPDWVVILQQVEIADINALKSVEELLVGAGYEGMMIRDPKAFYKNGRSSTKEGILLKVRRFKDSEAEILGVEEEMANLNVAKKDHFGRTERSTHQDNMSGKGSLGALIVKDVKTGVKFNIGTGFDRETRETLWDKRAKIVGKIVKYRFFEVGVKDAPRFPVFHGFRDKADMS